jgi:hypothetical protein
MWSKISPWDIHRRIKERQRERERQEFLKPRQPIYVIHPPIIDPQPINPSGNVPGYIAKFEVVITNQPDCIEPVEVYFNSARMRLDQKWGYGNLSMSFGIPNRLPNAIIPLNETREYQVNMVGFPERSSEPYLDLSQCYHWTIEGVTLSVSGLHAHVECHSEGCINGQGKST